MIFPLNCLLCNTVWGFIPYDIAWRERSNDLKFYQMILVTFRYLYRASDLFWLGLMVNLDIYIIDRMLQFFFFFPLLCFNNDYIKSACTFYKHFLLLNDNLESERVLKIYLDCIT